MHFKITLSITFNKNFYHGTVLWCFVENEHHCNELSQYRRCFQFATCHFYVENIIFFQTTFALHSHSTIFKTQVLPQQDRP